MYSKTPDIHAFPSISKHEVLSQSQLDDLKAGTLRLLKDVGVRFPSPKVLEIFADHGAEVNWDTEIVRIAPDLVEKALSTAPRSFILGGRERRFDLTLDGNNSYLSTDGCGTRVIDLETRQERHSRKEDVARMARISDALPLISFFWPLVSAQDHGLTAPFHECHAGLTNTLKHVRGGTTVLPELAPYLVEMATVVAGSEDQRRKYPPICANICGIAPLAHDQHGIETALVYAEAGIPTSFMAMPTMGSTAPATPWGALISGDAEVVSAMVLMQLRAAMRRVRIFPLAQSRCRSGTTGTCPAWVEVVLATMQKESAGGLEARPGSVRRSFPSAAVRFVDILGCWMARCCSTPSKSSSIMKFAWKFTISSRNSSFIMLTWR